MQGLNWQTMHLSLAGGLLQKADDRARQPPHLDIAKDVQYEELGGLQTRYPYAALSNAIVGGGTLSDCRRLAVGGDELLVFTRDALYSWSPSLAGWVLRATHLACSVDEGAVFATTSDQFDCDRAELDGVIVYAWAEPTGSNYGGSVRVAAVDKETGAVVLSPTTLSSSSGAQMPRLVALDTKILLCWVTTSVPTVRAVALGVDTLEDDLTASALVGTAILVTHDTEPCYDVARIPGADAALIVTRAEQASETSYLVTKITAALFKTTATKARTCDGPIAVAVTADGSTACVVRQNQVNGVEADVISAEGVLADTAHVGITIGRVTGPGLDRLTAAFRSVADDGEFRCYAFWSEDEHTDGTWPWQSSFNWIDTAGTTSGAAGEQVLARRLGVASRAFDHGGRVFVWGVFAGDSTFLGGNAPNWRAQLQNTYFLLRDDAFLVAKAAAARAGGFSETSHLPNVALVDGTTGYAWCGTEHRIIDLGGNGHTGYADRGPRDITFRFDAAEARRCARLGATLYLAGGQILQYDGAELVEVGFHLYPFSFEAAVSGAGSVEDGDYAYKATARWDNARGEVDRSTTATVATVTMAGGPAGIQMAEISPLFLSRKTTNPPAIEVWRTEKNPIADSPFFLASSNNPADAANPNRYLYNDTSADYLATFSDELSDAEIGDGEENPENGLLLENMAPPAASIILASDTRLFLAGIAGEPDRVRYSKIRTEGQVAAFHESLAVDVPPGGGAITALAILNDTLIVFRETAIYALPGTGYGNFGDADGSANFGPARVLSSDCGAVNQESVVVADRGIVFKSSKGWYLLNRGWGLDYIGAPVADYDDETPLAVHVLEAEHQIRILTAARMLVWDYLVNQWCEWTVADGLDAVIWQGAHVYLTATGPKQQKTTHDAVDYGLDVETSWIKPADLQGWARVRALLVLAEYRSSCKLRVRVAYNFDPTYVDDKIWTPSPATVGRTVQLKHGPKRPVCEAFKVRLTAVDADDTNNPPSGEALKLTGLSVAVGFKPGLYRRLPAAQKE